MLLADLLKPLVGKMEYFVKNTVNCSNDIQDIVMKEGEILNWHGVVSLFTDVLLKIIWGRLKLDTNLHECTNLT